MVSDEKVGREAERKEEEKKVKLKPKPLPSSHFLRSSITHLACRHEKHHRLKMLKLLLLLGFTQVRQAS